MRTFEIILLSIFAFCALVNAQWSSDPTINTPVCTAAGDQNSPSIINVGEGCSIVAWREVMNEYTSYIYAQKLNARGEPLWGKHGLLIFGEEKKYYRDFKLVSDNSGGMIISVALNSYADHLSSEIRVQKISTTGEKVWGKAGKSLASMSQNNETAGWLIGMVPDQEKGAIVLYKQRVYEQYELDRFFIARVNAIGLTSWSKPIFDIPYPQGAVSCFTDDGEGGALLTWIEFQTKYRLLVGRIDVEGSRFKQNVVCENDSIMSSPVIIRDGAGGSLVVWQDHRRAEANVELYIQRVDSDLLPLWSTVPLVNFDPKITIKGKVIAAAVKTGGAVFIWKEVGVQQYHHNSFFRAFRIINNSEKPWGAAGKSWQISEDSGFPMDDLQDYEIVNDLNDNFILIENLLQGRGPEIIRCRKLKLDGSTIWSGKVISSHENSHQKGLATISDGVGGAVSIWLDQRNANWDIFAQQINAFGDLGTAVFPYNNESVQTLAIAPDNPDILFAGTYDVHSSKGNVYKTKNAGLTWEKVLTDKRIESIAIDQKNSRVLYAATFGDKIFKSTDGGLNWFPLTSGISDSHIRTVAIDPVNSNIIYAGSAQGEFYKSTNAGNVWVQKNNGLPANDNDFRPTPHSIAIDPSNNSNLYVGTYQGVFKSTHGAENWLKLANYNVMPIIINPDDPNILYCGCDARNGFMGLIKSTDAGKNWSPVGPTNYRFLDLVIEPYNSNILYAACIEPGGVFKSIDAGITWNRIGLDSLLIRCLALESRRQVLYAGVNSGGIFKISVYRPSKTIFVPTEYATIQMAIDNAIDGDTILVAPGRYAITTTIKNNRVNRLTLLGSRRKNGTNASIIEPTVNQRNYIAILFVNVQYCTIAGFEVWNAYTGITIDSCKYCEIRQNHLHDNNSNGIEVYHSKNIGIYYNIIDNNNFHGIELQYHPINIQIINNSILHTRNADGICLYDYCENIIIKNNILAYSRQQGIELVYLRPGSPVNFVNDYNCFWENGHGAIRDGFSTGSHSIHADPLMVDPTNRNYFLQPESPCLGAGENGVHIGALSLEFLDGKIIPMCQIQLPFTSGGIKVRSRGRNVCCTDYNGKLIMVDVTNPDAPQLHGQIEDLPGSNIHDLWYSDNSVFTAHRFGGINMIDVTNPDEPKVISNAATNYCHSGLYSVGNYLYYGEHSLGGNPGGIRIYDISQRLLNQTGTWFGEVDGQRLIGTQDGKYLYQTTSREMWPPAKMVIYDVSDKAHPLKINAFNEGYHAKGLALSSDEKYLYINTAYDWNTTPTGLQIWEISNRTKPLLINTFNGVKGGPMAYDPIEYVLFTTTEKGTLYALDVSRPNRIMVLDSIPGLGLNWLDFQNGYLYTVSSVPGDQPPYYLKIFQFTWLEPTDIHAKVKTQIPVEFLLCQNYPNPFNPTTCINYQLPKSAPVVIRIYNLLGQEIRTLVNQHQAAGYHSVFWNGRDNNNNPVVSGIYVYQLQTGTFTSNRKMVVLK